MSRDGANVVCSATQRKLQLEGMPFTNWITVKEKDVFDVLFEMVVVGLFNVQLHFLEGT